MENNLHIRLSKTTKTTLFFQIIINNQPLDQLLGIDRLQDLAYAQSDLDIALPVTHESVERAKEVVAVFLGKRAPANQWGSGRVVLFRCHCGSDYCGVISCKIVESEEQIGWINIAKETDDDAQELTSLLPDLYFDKTQYTQAFENYLMQIKS